MLFLDINPIFIIFFVVGIVIFGVVFAFAMMMMFGTKLKGKMLSNQFKSLNIATGMSKEEIENMITNLEGASIKAHKNVVSEHEEDLKDIADTTARASKGAVETTARAIKKGFAEEEKVYCKYCGSLIDSDSKFCKSCGKKIN